MAFSYQEFIMQAVKVKKRQSRIKTQLKIKLEHLLFVHAIRQGDIGDDPYATHLEIANMLKKKYGIAVSHITIGRRYRTFVETGVVKKGLPAVNVDERYQAFLESYDGELNSKNTLYKPYEQAPQAPSAQGEPQAQGQGQPRQAVPEVKASVPNSVLKMNQELKNNGKTTANPSPILNRTLIEASHPQKEQSKGDNSVFDPSQFMPKKWAMSHEKKPPKTVAFHFS